MGAALGTLGAGAGSDVGAVLGTLGAGANGLAVLSISLGDDVGATVGCWLTVSKMVANFVRAAWFSSRIGESGEAWLGFCSAWMSSLAASVAASALEVLGMATCFGNHFSVWLTHSARVSGT